MDQAGRLANRSRPSLPVGVAMGGRSGSRVPISCRSLNLVWCQNYQINQSATGDHPSTPRARLCRTKYSSATVYFVSAVKRQGV